MEIEFKKTIEKRWELCQNCESFKHETKQCKECGCFMFIKILLPPATCPLNKW